MYSFSCTLYLWIYSLEIINHSERAVCYEMEKLKVHLPAAPEFELNYTFTFVINYAINVFRMNLDQLFTTVLRCFYEKYLFTFP